MLQAEIATLIRTLTTGIYGIGAHRAGERRIFTASWVTPVSFDPVMIALSINPQGQSYPLIQESRSFSVNVIGREHPSFAEVMAGPGDRLKRLRWSEGVTGCPLLEEAIAHIECRVIHEYPAGDHQLIVGEVIAGKHHKTDESPLLYGETGNLDGAIALFPKEIGG